jgi:hypothetical protein
MSGPRYVGDSHNLLLAGWESQYGPHGTVEAVERFFYEGNPALLVHTSALWHKLTLVYIEDQEWKLQKLEEGLESSVKKVLFKWLAKNSPPKVASAQQIIFIPSQ